MKLFRLAAIAAVALSLAGCMSITSAPPGPYALKSDYSVTLGRQWSDMSAVNLPRPKKVRLLSIDGVLLNRLYLTEGMDPGDFMVRSLVKEKPTPTVRAGMSASERIEFVTQSVAAMDYQRVEAVKPRPAKFGGADAVRFDLTAKTTDGLDISGTALVSEIGGKLYVVLYLAPAEHYFAATLPEVEQVLASIRTAA